MAIVSASELTMADNCGELLHEDGYLEKTCGLVPEGNMDAVKNPGKFPFAVSIQKGNKHWCSGTILSSRMIIASTNCLYSLDPDGIEIIVGKNNLANKTDKCSKIFKVSKIRLHPEYNTKTLQNNLAIVKLKYSIKFAHYSDGFGNNDKICIPKSCSLCENLVLASWTKKGQMKSIKYKIVDQSYCNIENRDKRSSFCVEVKSGKPNSLGDLGAPLTKVSDGRYNLVGIMNDLLSKNSFKKIINVKYYLKWINKTIKELK